MHNYIIYGGIDSRTFNIYFELETVSILPEADEYVQNIPILDGVIDYNIRKYGRRLIRASAVFAGKLSQLRKQRDQIELWLSNNGTPKKLILGDNPERYYLAKVFSAIDFECKSDHHLGEVVFVCNPPWAFLKDGTQLTPEQVLWVDATTEENQFIKEFSANGSIRFANNGSSSVKPLIKLIGYVKSGITLTYKNKSFKLNTDCINDGIAVDCKEETVTRMSDGENLSQYIDAKDDYFFTVDSGNAEIFLTMPEISDYPRSVTVIVEFNAMEGI